MQPGARQVILVLYRRGWATAVGEGLSFSEARLAVALHDHPGGGRLLLVNPYRTRRRRFGVRCAALSGTSPAGARPRPRISGGSGRGPRGSPPEYRPEMDEAVVEEKTACDH